MLTVPPYSTLNEKGWLLAHQGTQPWASPACRPWYAPLPEWSNWRSSRCIWRGPAYVGRGNGSSSGKGNGVGLKSAVMKPRQTSSSGGKETADQEDSFCAPYPRTCRTPCVGSPKHWGHPDRSLQSRCCSQGCGPSHLPWPPAHILPKEAAERTCRHARGGASPRLMWRFRRRPPAVRRWSLRPSGPAPSLKTSTLSAYTLPRKQARGIPGALKQPPQRIRVLVNTHTP